MNEASTMAAHRDTPQAAGSVSSSSNNQALASSKLNHEPAGEQVTSFSNLPEEKHRRECGEEGIMLSLDADNISDTQTDRAKNVATSQEKSIIKDCQCGSRQHQPDQSINPSVPPVKSNEHYLLATVPASPVHLNCELIAGFRPPHYYYAPSLDQLQYSAAPAGAAAYATLSNHQSYYQNCYPYSYPLNFELCYFQSPQLLPHYTQPSYSPKQHLLLLSNHHYNNQQQLQYSTPNLGYNHHLSSLKSLQSTYQLYQPTFYAPLLPTLPTSSPHQPPIRSHTAHDPQLHSYPISTFNCYTQSFNKPPSSANGITSDMPRIQDLLSYLPIEAQPAKVRQAYGMDKVWNDEFELLFSQLAPEVSWTFIEVESNPMIMNPDSILAYRGHYIIAKRQFIDDDGRDGGFSDEEEEEERKSCSPEEEATTSNDERDEAENKPDLNSIHSDDCLSNSDNLLRETEFKGKDDEDKESSTSSSELVDSKDSDCDSGTQTNCSSASSETLTNYQSTTLSKEQSISAPRNGNLTTRFRMFIDSAKVRFCCNQCGHGWTSMKGRVVFWYELFELVDERDESDTPGTLIGYCAYKLFGQQCDVCKVENRFERPMWYPEEVSKVLNNMYNKVGQVYFGFQMPTIDKQRRAGKPKTSHNSSLCQACQNGLCTDRK